MYIYIIVFCICIQIPICPCSGAYSFFVLTPENPSCSFATLILNVRMYNLLTSVAHFAPDTCTVYTYQVQKIFFEFFHEKRVCCSYMFLELFVVTSKKQNSFITSFRFRSPYQSPPHLCPHHLLIPKPSPSPSPSSSLPSPPSLSTPTSPFSSASLPFIFLHALYSLCPFSSCPFSFIFPSLSCSFPSFFPSNH